MKIIEYFWIFYFEKNFFYQAFDVKFIKNFQHKNVYFDLIQIYILQRDFGMKINKEYISYLQFAGTLEARLQIYQKHALKLVFANEFGKDLSSTHWHTHIESK